MTNLIAACIVFLAIHLVVSGTPLRDVIVGAIGEKPYRGLFSLASLGTIVWMCIAFNGAESGQDNHVLFDTGHFRDLGVIVIFLAFFLAVPGVTRRSPTAMDGEGAPIDGVLRITRHPFLWAVILWSAFHLIVTGTLAATIFFGTFFLVAAIGTRAIDGKIRRNRAAEWQAISAQTSNVPFAAIAARRNNFVAREYFDWRFALAIALFATFLFVHRWLFSASPFPGSSG